MRKLNVAVVGCGEIAIKHLKILSKIPQVLVISLCDVNEKRLKEVSSAWGIKRCYRDLEDMLSKENISILDICTPPHVHKSQIIQATKFGVNILVEKPLVLSVQEANEVLNVVRRSEIKLCVIHNDKFQPGLIDAIKRAHRGEIGQIISTHQEYLGTRNNPMLINKAHWCHRLPGGRIGECLPHPIYVAQTFLGNDLKVKAAIPLKLGSHDWVSYDELYVILSKNDKYAAIHVSFNSLRNTNEVKIYGEKGMFKVNLYTRNVLKFSASAPEGKLEKFVESFKEAAQTSLNIIKYGSLSLLRRLRSGHEVCIRAFVDSVLHDKEVPVSLEEAYHNVRICEQICREVDKQLKQHNARVG